MSEKLPDCGVVKMKWSRKAKVSSTTGSFDFSQKVYDWGARIREVEVSVRSLSEEEERIWRGFLLRVDGQIGNFQLSPSGSEFPAGAIHDKFGRWKGSAVVDGANQTGKVLSVRGLPVSEEVALAEGDWFSLGGVLHEVTANVSSDGNGLGTISLWRALAIAPADGAALDLEKPEGTFKMLGGIPILSWSKEQRGEPFSFRAREVLS